MTIDGETSGDTVWDAVVIGGGLAGSVVAARLADAGARVLLAEAKHFPRPKTCGGCLNSRAIAGLEAAGFGTALQACEPTPINRIDLRHAGRSLSIPLPAGKGVTRETLDAALLAEVRCRGVEVCEGVRARVIPLIEGNRRVVELRDGDRATRVRSQLVLACDGLGHPCLTGVPDFAPVVAADSRVGVGAVLEKTDTQALCPPGAIVMAVGTHGYVGMAVCERGRLNIAAAFDTRALRASSPAESVRRTIEHAGLPPLPDAEPITWRGSPRLSQHAPQVAGERLFLVGDAAGYVEPFTGEGMAAAVEGALAVAPLALRAIDVWNATLADEWQATYTQHVRRGQNTCRAIAWMLKRPLATRLGLGAAAVAPAIGRAVAARVGAG